MSLLHICLVVVALKNLAVQFMTSITSDLEYEKISAKRDLMNFNLFYALEIRLSILNDGVNF